MDKRSPSFVGTRFVQIALGIDRDRVGESTVAVVRRAKSERGFVHHFDRSLRRA